MIEEKKTISRGEFLATLGSIGAAVVLAKFGNLKGITNAIKPHAAKVATTPGSYGNHTYGGKNA
jgi:hypothetical protein